MCLQNLLPNSEFEEQISDVYCHQQSICSVAELDLSYLKHILLHDHQKLLSLWKIIAHRLISLNDEKLPQFHLLTRDRIQQFCKMSVFKMYKSGEPVNLNDGAIVFRGYVSGLHENLEEMERQMQ